MDLVSGVNTATFPRDWFFSTHQHQGIEIVGVLRGQVTLNAGDDSWHACEREILVIPPHLSHSWSSQYGTELAIAHLLSVSRDLADRLLPGYYPRLIRLPAPQFAEYTALFTRVAATPQRSSSQRRLLNAYLEAFLLTILEGCDSAHSVVQEAIAYMQAHLRENFSVARLARRFLMSEATIRRHFRQFLGVSPRQYLLELRLTEARRLMTTSQLTIQEIAARTGFYDPAHFSSTFRKRFGLSPTSWRAEECAHITASSFT
ncbi:MAG: helix-turn-helix domain-containing protein [Ktedonobacteraceae bacterium]|nr:helix-turn-helix domain-containing protein [Ktedonobacteraceae bacterium]MBO0791177.1 helix-turn-helix domain-containing protein [Ktedonobacteraceae bacterium]